MWDIQHELYIGQNLCKWKPHHEGIICSLFLVGSQLNFSSPKKTYQMKTGQYKIHLTNPVKILQFPVRDFKKGFEPIVDCVDSMTSFIITCILGMTPDTSDTHHSEKCKCQQLDYVHPPTNSHQKNKEGSRREEKFSYATSPHAAVAAAAHHVALLH